MGRGWKLAYSVQRLAYRKNWAQRAQRAQRKNIIYIEKDCGFGSVNRGLHRLGGFLELTEIVGLCLAGMDLGFY